jgi:two-component system, sensor histidine kinase and response regulator
MAESVPIPAPLRGRSLTRITHAAVGVVLLVVAAIFVSFILVTRSFEQEADGAIHAERVLQTANTLERTVIDIETGLRGYLLTRDERFLEPYQRARHDLPELERDLSEQARVPVQQRRAAGIIGATDEFVRGYAEPVRASRPTRGDMTAVLATGKREVDALRVRFAVFDAAEQRLIDERHDRTHARSGHALTIAVSGVLATVILLLSPAGFLHRFVMQPILRVSRAAQRLATGDREARVPSTGLGEVALLGDSFNAMAGALSRREAELEVAHDRLEGILRHTTMAISVKDRDGRYLIVNRAWEESAGYRSDDIVGRADADFEPPAHAARTRASDLEVLRSGRVLELERSRGGRTFAITKSRCPSATARCTGWPASPPT